jgi:hypothetical protein
MKPRHLIAYQLARDEISNAISRAVTLQNKLLAERASVKQDEWDLRWRDGDIDTVTQKGVTVDWTEYYSRGGMEHGTYFLPVECLADDTYVQAISDLVDAALAEKETARALKALKEQRAKVDRLAALQAEIDGLKAELG